MKIKYLKYKLLTFTLLCFGFISISQNRIDGKITDYKSNEALVGANVVIKEENIGTTTDFEGKFSIEFKKLPIKIEFSYISEHIQNYSQSFSIDFLRKSSFSKFSTLHKVI